MDFMQVFSLNISMCLKIDTVINLKNNNPGKILVIEIKCFPHFLVVLEIILTLSRVVTQEAQFIFEKYLTILFSPVLMNKDQSISKAIKVQNLLSTDLNSTL